MKNRPVDPGSIQGSHRPISFIRINIEHGRTIICVNIWCTTQLAKLSFNHSHGSTHSWRFSIFLLKKTTTTRRVFPPKFSFYCCHIPGTRYGLFHQIILLIRPHDVFSWHQVWSLQIILRPHGVFSFTLTHTRYYMMQCIHTCSSSATYIHEFRTFLNMKPSHGDTTTARHDDFSPFTFTCWCHIPSTVLPRACPPTACHILSFKWRHILFYSQIIF